jgi:putative acetyltransferase
MHTQPKIEIVPIEPKHNASLALIIRNALTEFNAAKPGTVFYDESTDRLSSLFEQQGSCYFTVLIDGEVRGGAGIYPTEGLPDGTCEFVKLYLAPDARGKGIGKLLMQQCEIVAVRLQYTHIYLETLPELTIAVPLYEKMGYQYLPGPLGNSGHGGCNIWMLKSLSH